MIYISAIRDALDGEAHSRTIRGASRLPRDRQPDPWDASQLAQFASFRSSADKPCVRPYVSHITRTPRTRRAGISAFSVKSKPPYSTRRSADGRCDGIDVRIDDGRCTSGTFATIAVVPRTVVEAEITTSCSTR